MNKLRTTKAIAEETGVSIHTLRYYEHIGLLDPVERAGNGHRRYTDEDVARVNFLRHLRNTNMSIADIQRHIELHRAGATTLRERRLQLEAQRELIRVQIQALEATAQLLDEKITHYMDMESKPIEEVMPYCTGFRRDLQLIGNQEETT